MRAAVLDVEACAGDGHEGIHAVFRMTSRCPTSRSSDPGARDTRTPAAEGSPWAGNISRDDYDSRLAECDLTVAQGDGPPLRVAIANHSCRRVHGMKRRAFLA